MALILVLLTGHAARADAIKGWAGASASAGYDDASRAASTRTGPTATASNSWSQTTLYNAGSGFGPQSKVLPVNQAFEGHLWDAGFAFIGGSNGRSSASADPTSGSLLKVSADTVVGNPGTYHGSIGSQTSVASADWTGDRLTVSAPAGSALPDAVQLQLRLQAVPTYGPYLSQPRGYGTIQATVNDKSITLINPYFEPEKFDSIDPTEYRTGLFHVDLKLDSAGISDEIALHLLATAKAYSQSNAEGTMTQEAGLSIVGVNFADGTSLASRGYGVAFDSGLVVPGTVPEPASVVTWGLIAAGASGLLRRQARRGGARA